MPTEVADGVFDITSKVTDDGKRYRVFLFTDRTPTLIDAGLPDTTDVIIEGIEDVGVTPERLVVTHGDHDHIGGFDAVVDEYDPETWVPEQMNEDFEEPGAVARARVRGGTGLPRVISHRECP